VGVLGVRLQVPRRLQAEPHPVAPPHDAQGVPRELKQDVGVELRRTRGPRPQSLVWRATRMPRGRRTPKPTAASQAWIWKKSRGGKDKSLSRNCQCRVYTVPAQRCTTGAGQRVQHCRSKVAALGRWLVVFCLSEKVNYHQKGRVLYRVRQSTVLSTEGWLTIFWS